MASDPASEHVFPSTTWSYEMRKIKQRPKGTAQPRAKRGPFRGLCQWPRRRTLRLSVTYRGGAESWWLVETRGTRAAFPGHLCLEDVMTVVLNEPWGRPAA